MKISEKTQNILKDYAQHVLNVRRQQEELYYKMELVDIAYARYMRNIDPKTGVVHGEGIDAATTPAGVFNTSPTVPPIVVSQVESMVGYLSEIFLSGSPLFPIVSNPSNREAAGALESLIDDHATMGGYARQLLLFFRKAMKYNLAAVECFPESLNQYIAADEYLAPEVTKVNKQQLSFTRLESTDMYNTFWDPNVMPGDISRVGDYAGTIEILSKPRFKRLLNGLSDAQEVINADVALRSFITGDAAANFRMHPTVSKTIAPKTPTSLASFLGMQSEIQKGGIPILGNYEIVKIYARLCPSDIGMDGPARNTPQIFKILMVNGEHIIHVKRVLTAYDYLPILFGQPFEDGLWYQTQSLAESMIPIQESAQTLFAIRFNAARRAVSDRALYDPTVINPKDVNSPVPTAKIPVRSNMLNEKPLSAFYAAIPFDARGTETALQDAVTITSFGDKLSGLNGPMQGQFQRGNKSVQEWNDTMGNSDSRLRLPALALESQFMTPLKELLKFNILQNTGFGQKQTVRQQTGQVLDIDLVAMRQGVFAFQVADGYTPKSKLASTDAIVQIMMMISQSPILQQTMGQMLPGIVAHLAQLMGVKGLEEYMPVAPQSSPQLGEQNGNIDLLRQRDQELRQQALDNRTAELGMQ